MLEGYGLHQLVWDACDERFGDVLVASPADAQGRGISLAIRQDGAAEDMTGSAVYLVWRHKVTGERGTEPFTEIDASSGTFEVYYPAAMQEAEGAVLAQVMVSRGDETYISSRVFTIRVEPVLVGGEEHEDGFTLFLEAVNAYENATEITTDAATAANAAATAANNAASNATSIAEGIQAAAQRGDYDGADGFSPTATVTQTESGATITITDANGTTTADIAKGAQGEKGDAGETGPQGETGPAGADGADGEDGVSCTHSWNGTVLTVTSASGTSSADLVGPQGPQGETGATGATGAQGPQGETGATGATGPQGPQGETGPAGADGTTFEPASPLSLSDGVLSVDLSGYAEDSDLPPKIWHGMWVPEPEEGALETSTYLVVPYDGLKVGDYFVNTMSDRMSVVESMGGSEGEWTVGVRGVLDLAKVRGILPTTDIDLEDGVSGSAQVDVWDHALVAGALLLNTTSGNLMQVTSHVDAASSLGVSVSVEAVGIGNVFGGGDLSGYAALAGATFTGAVSGITPTADANFATKKYVDDAIAALDDLSEESF